MTTWEIPGFADVLAARDELRGRRVALVASGGNVSREQLLEILA
jgi:hypothetical protein